MNDLPLHDLRTGSAVAQGHFSLDEKLARQKLQQFQLLDPHRYVLEFVKAAHLLQATDIRFHIDRTRLEMTFDGQPLTIYELLRLFSAPFTPHDTDRQRALRHLAIGAYAALGLGLTTFTITTADDTGQSLCLLQDTVRQLPERPLHFDGSTRIVLTKKKTPRHLLRAWTRSRKKLPEITLLTHHCQFSSTQILCNDAPIAKGFRFHDVLTTTHFSDDKTKGIVAISFDDALIRRGEPTIEAYILQQGVLIDRIFIPSPLLNAKVLIHTQNLTTDLSQSAFVKDHDWFQLQNLITSWTRKAAMRFLRSQVLDLDHQRLLMTFNLLQYSLQNHLPAAPEKLLSTTHDFLKEIYKSSPPATRAAAQPLAATLQHVTTRYENRKRLAAHPIIQDLSPRYFPHQRTWRGLGAKNSIHLTAAIGPRIASEVLFIVEDRLFSRHIFKDDTLGLHLRFYGDLQPNQDLTDLTITPELLFVFKKSASLLSFFLQSTYPSLDKSRQRHLRELLQTNYLRTSLMPIYRWSSWPPELELSLAESILPLPHQQKIPATPRPQNKPAPPQRPPAEQHLLDRLDQFFADNPFILIHVSSTLHPISKLDLVESTLPTIARQHADTLIFHKNHPAIAYAIAHPKDPIALFFITLVLANHLADHTHLILQELLTSKNLHPTKNHPA